MELTKNVKNNETESTEIATQTKSPLQNLEINDDQIQPDTHEQNVEVIEAESSDDGGPTYKAGPSNICKNVTSEEEFSDFGSDDSIKDKDYFPSSSSGSDGNPQNLFDDTIEGKYFLFIVHRRRIYTIVQLSEILCSINKILYSFSDSDDDDDSESDTSDNNEDNENADNNNANIAPLAGLDINNWNDITLGQLPFMACRESAEFNFDVSEITTPLDAYKLFVTEDLWQLIVEETNRFAQQSLTGRRASKSRLKVWVDTDKNEIMRFFSIILVMGFNSLPSVNSYWSKDPMFKNEFIANTMPRDRFLLLHRCLHFCNNEDTFLDTSDRLYKIKTALGILNKNFQTVLTPGRILVIDESMVPFRGRLKFRQYIPNKTHKYGVKLYKLCTVDGYTIQIIVYTGKNEKVEGQQHSETMVIELLKSVEAKVGHYLFADNFYSSLPLAKKLFDEKIVYCGTLRANRKGIPKSFQKKMKKGETYGQQNECVKVLKWIDKRPVLMLTTDPTHTSAVQETGKKSRKGEDIAKPKCVIDYNKAKKGVDYSDQMSSYHSVLRRGIKWYRKVMNEFLFGTCVVNAWIIYNKISNKKMSITNFRKTLAEQLSESPTTVPETSSRKRVHTFVKPTGPGRKKRKICKGCYQNLRATISSREANKKVSKVTSFCEECPGKPGMCLPCFNKVHK